jgi:hypothetical protein
LRIFREWRRWFGGIFRRLAVIGIIVIVAIVVIAGITAARVATGIIPLLAWGLLLLIIGRGLRGDGSQIGRRGGILGLIRWR